MKDVAVQILGKSFVFSVPDEIDAADFMQIIDFVEKKISKIKSSIDELDTFRLGLLTAINITEEYFSLRRENERLKIMLSKIDHMLTPWEDEANEDITIRYSKDRMTGG